MASGKEIKIDYSKTYLSNRCGPFKIIKELPKVQSGTILKRAIQIRFLLTGTIKNVLLLDALNGNVKDPYYPTVADVGCLGDYTKYQHHCKNLYDIWFHMISRCYNENDESFKAYGARGVHVDARWFCYEHFLADVIHVPGYDEYINSLINGGTKYQFDKDMKQPNVENKIYSLETCCFIPAVMNTKFAVRDYKNKRSSQYYGVHKLEENGHYQSSVNINGKKHFLGTFKDEVDAAIAYNNEVLMYSDTRCHNLNEFIIAKAVENKKEENNIIFAKVVK